MPELCVTSYGATPEKYLELTISNLYANILHSIFKNLSKTFQYILKYSIVMQPFRLSYLHYKTYSLIRICMRVCMPEGQQGHFSGHRCSTETSLLWRFENYYPSALTFLVRKGENWTGYFSWETDLNIIFLYKSAFRKKDFDVLSKGHWKNNSVQIM